MQRTSFLSLAPSHRRDVKDSGPKQWFASTPFTQLVTFVWMALGLLLTGFICMDTARADEPADEFIAALRAAGETRIGYFDVALDYLDRNENNPRIDPAFRERIPLVRVEIMLDKVNRMRDPRQINTILDDVDSKLKAFISADPGIELLSKAQTLHARMLLRRAARLLVQAKSDRMTVEKRTQLQSEARQYLDQAKQAFESIRARLRKELENFGDPGDDLVANRKLKRLQDEYIRIRLQAPGILEQLADSYGEQDANYLPLLNQSAEQYVDLFKKYSGRKASIDAAIGAGRVLHKLGNHSEAVSYLLEVFLLPEGEIQNRKKLVAALVALDCWEATEPYPVYEVQTYLSSIIFSLSAEDRESASGIRLQIAYAEACHQIAEKIRADGPADAEQRKEMNQLAKEATRVLRALARIAGPHRTEVAQTLREWGESVASPTDANAPPPATMEEARQVGLDLRLEAIDADALYKATEKLLEASDLTETARVRLELERDEHWKKLDQLNRRALEAFRQAIRFTDPTTAADDLSNLYYLQCDCYLRMRRYLETTIIGEFLVANFPNNVGARPAAGAVCQAYWALFAETKSNSLTGNSVARNGDGTDSQTPEFYKAKLREYCQLIFQLWPGTTQSELAGLLMTEIALDENDPMLAYDYLKKIPSDSPTHLHRVLRVAVQLWRSYVTAQRDSQSEISEESLRELVVNAKTLMEDTIPLLDIQTLTPFEANSVLTLAQIYLELEENDNAIELLESASIAPLDLVKQKHPSTELNQYRWRTYRVALRAYLTQMKTDDDTLQWTEKSEHVLAALEAETANAPDGQKQMAQIYLELSRELVRQFDGLDSIQKKKSFAQALETLILGIKNNARDSELQLLCGVMLSNIGDDLKQSGLGDEAFSFFDQAGDIYQALLKDRRLPDDRFLAIQRGLANAHRGKGDYDMAIQQFVSILNDPANRSYVDLQIDAAATYQEWGTDRKDSKYLVKAINGGAPSETDNKRLIWGWNKLASALRRANKDELFAEVILALAETKFEYGVQLGETKWKELAIKELENFQQNVPSMGGAQWKPKIESALGRMRSSLDP